MMCRLLEGMRNETVKESMISVALRMLELGKYTLEDISYVVDLPLDEVKRLRTEQGGIMSNLLEDMRREYFDIGREEVSLNVARRMLELNKNTLEDIATVSGLSFDEIKRLQAAPPCVACAVIVITDDSNSILPVFSTSGSTKCLYGTIMAI